MPASKRRIGGRIFLLGTEEETCRFMGFCGELKESTSNWRHVVNTPKNGRNTGATKTFLHRPQDIVVVITVNDDQAIGIEPVGKQTMSV
jgi:hypothetical protein